ncbi:MAG TPA: GH25 family lysozyme [Streptosporangiaceae bacterium]
MRPQSAALATASSIVQGIDVASFQHPNGVAINWTQVAQAGYKFAFIKASEGSYYTNPYYPADANGARSAGMFAAPYAFAIPNDSGGTAQVQADDALVQASKAAPGLTLPLILDIEYDPYARPVSQGGDGTKGWCYGLTQPAMVAWISAFVTEAQLKTGQLPVIYSTQGWWDTCTGDSAAFTADPLWIASYASTPAMPGAWAGNWTYWQYTNAATVPGVQAKTDASWLRAPGNQSDQTGSQISRPLHVLAGGGAVTFSAPTLPTGLQIDASTGVVTGQLPGSAATFPVSMTTSAAGGPSFTQSFTWDVHGTVSLGALSSRTGSVGSPVRYQVPAADGLPGCTLQFSASGLPSGLTMTDCGLISGWPSTSGRYTVHVQVTDSSGTALATGSFVWTIARASGHGPAGHIRLSRDGKCLAALSATDIAIEPCSTAGNQHWTIAADGTVRVSGSCLTAKAAGALAITACNGTQRWQLGTNAMLRYLSAGKCLSDTGARNGARAVAALCRATWPSQRWTLPAGPLTSGIPGYCASNQRVVGQRFGAVTLRPCNGTSGQAWTVEPDGALSIGGKCAALNGGATTPGTRVRLVTCAQSASQVWQLAGGPIGMQIVSRAAGLCLADPGDRAVSGTQLVIEPCVAGDPGMAWRVS